MTPDRDAPPLTPAGRREQLDRELSERAERGLTVAQLIERGRRASYAASRRAETARRIATAMAGDR